ncbi:MAG: discoidin domain-containing protein [Verrucomicrobiae bacterium]|nr:discoidin domain-containing protein [Verrucomicrobiae bacterium]
MKTLCLHVALVLTLPVAAAATPLPADAWQDLLHQEWIQEARALAEAPLSHPPTPPDDAAGGCDGITTGGYGFHTDLDDTPWWQVDLGQIEPIRDVRLWNRTDSEDMARRAARFQILLSHDGTTWTSHYQHPDRLFYGYRMPDRSPLVIPLTNALARFVRIQLPERTFLHLDEIEIHGARRGSGNLALHRPATQSSVSEWSTHHPRTGIEPDWSQLTRDILDRLATADPSLVPPAELQSLRHRLAHPTPQASAQSLYLDARALQRRVSLASPLLDFETILFTQRVPGSYSHMSDQYYGWWSRPGGGLFLLRNFKQGPPTLQDLTGSLFPHPGSFLRPDLSFDARRVLFAWCRHYPHLAAEKDKLNKANIPEDAFYHLFEMNLDGSGLRQLTRGKYDNFDGRYLPDGRIVFLSTRRGQAVQVGPASAAASLASPDLPDCYVRCGGDESRPVAVYTLHTINPDGSGLLPISPFEMFEWEPSVAHDGSILYSRWDYVDRDNMPYMSLWSIHPDGTHARLIYGNYTQAPHCTFEPRAIPGSHKIIFTASGHHAQTMGSLVLLDPARATEGEDPITRLTPHIPFPEIEAWPRAYYASPWPLSESTHLVSWGVEPDIREGRTRPHNGMGIHLFNAGSGLELLYRHPDISSMYPIPVKPRPIPPVRASSIDWAGPQQGAFLIADVTRGLSTAQPGEITNLRIVAIPAKTQPRMDQPSLGLTRDDPGKAVLGTVPVEPDGSAHFLVPSGVALFFQALNADGLALQSMRSATHVQPGQTLSCTGCHDSRLESPPPARPPLAASRPPSRITPGPDGSWPLRFDRLVQPVLDALCVSCHQPGAEDAVAARFNLTPAHAYDTLARYGQPSVRDLILEAYREGVSRERRQPALLSPLLALLSQPDGHHGVALDTHARNRLVTWLDTYAQRLGSFSDLQEQELIALRASLPDVFLPNP